MSNEFPMENSHKTLVEEVSLGAKGMSFVMEEIREHRICKIEEHATTARRLNAWEINVLNCLFRPLKLVILLICVRYLDEQTLSGSKSVFMSDEKFENH